MTIKVKVLKCGEDGSSLYFKLLDESDVLVTVVDCQKKDMMGFAIEGYMGKLDNIVYGFNIGYPVHLNHMLDDHWELEIFN